MVRRGVVISIGVFLAFVLLDFKIIYSRENLVAGLGLANFAFADTVVLQWNANTEPDVAGYRLYATHVAGQYTFGSGNEIATFGPNVTEASVELAESDQDWFFVLTAFDTSGNESGPGNEVSRRIDDTPSSPGDEGSGGIDDTPSSPGDEGSGGIDDTPPSNPRGLSMSIVRVTR